MMGVAFEIQIHWPRPTLESARLKDSMDVGDANEFQKGDENRLMSAYEVDRGLVRVVAAIYFQLGDCVSEGA